MKNSGNYSTKGVFFDRSINKILFVIILGFVLFYAIGVVITEKNFIFDDSFITYRYSKNLAQGYGITWNPNEQPVEGYTNFLLVVLLAPFIKIGVSPLLVTRILSLLCAVMMFVLLFRFCMEYYPSKNNLSLVIAALFLLISNTIPLSMVGLETLIFSTAIFIAFLFGGKFLETDQIHLAYYFGAFSFVSFLLRPEALLLLVSFGCVTITKCWKKKLAWTMAIRLLKAVLISFVIPTLIYFIWKYIHFGTIVPNPFLIKVTSSGFYSPIGLESVLSFWLSHFTIILAGLFSFLLARSDDWQRSVSAWLCILYFLFFMRVDTLMNIYDRFLYPTIIFLVILSIPTFKFMFEYIQAVNWRGFLKPLFVILLLLALTGDSLQESISNFKDIVKGRDNYSQSDALMQREYCAALALSQYPGISKIRIAFGDAGVIPYFTEALSLDTVGLNDRFIAKERDLSKLTDYFFSQQPDLILQPGNQNLSWVTNGHGPMGNYKLWATDNRWDKYAYIGTIETDFYDIHMFLSLASLNFSQFKDFLRNYVADGYYIEFPISIGSYNPTLHDRPNWIPLPGKHCIHTS